MTERDIVESRLMESITDPVTGERIYPNARPDLFAVDVQDVLDEIGRLRAALAEAEQSFAQSNAAWREMFDKAEKREFAVTAQLAKAKEALEKQKPPFRAPGDNCWCAISRDIEGYGHADNCLAARAFLTSLQSEE